MSTTKKGKKSSVASADQIASEKRFKEDLKRLTTESESVSGRDAGAIKASTVELHDSIVNSNISSEAQKKLLEQLKKLQDDVDAEDKLEKTCGRVIQLSLLFTSIVPLFLTFLGTMSEYATRPTLITSHVDMQSQKVVIIGGCGALGSELGMMFASSGADVILGCRETESYPLDVQEEFDEPAEGFSDMDTEAQATKLNQMKQRTSDRLVLNQRLKEKGYLDDIASTTTRGKVSIWPIDLESFSSVAAFANQYMEREPHLDLLVHAAATKEGCIITEDGYELSHQVNFLAPALLTQLLLPVLGVDVNSAGEPNHSERSTRIVYTTCDAALQLPDWLPWPMRRIDPYMLPQVNLGRLVPKQNTGGTLQQCSALTEYANAKLSNAVHAKELSRRLSSRTSVSTHIANPGGMDTRFGQIAGPPTNRVSARAKVMSYLPPVWIGKKVWSMVSSKFSFSTMLLRNVEAGAKMLFHVCTSSALEDMRHPGGFYSDTAGVNVNCGKDAWECSRLPPAQLPDAVLNKTLGVQLWRGTDEVIRKFMSLEDSPGHEVTAGRDRLQEAGDSSSSSSNTVPKPKEHVQPRMKAVEVGNEADIEEIEAEWD